MRILATKINQFNRVGSVNSALIGVFSVGEIYILSGFRNHKITNISSGSTVNIKGFGKVTIDGIIGEDVVFNVSGLGSVIINATVEGALTFNCGTGRDVIFRVRPPEHVVNLIRSNPDAPICMPKATLTMYNESYAGIVGKLSLMRSQAFSLPSTDMPVEQGANLFLPITPFKIPTTTSKVRSHHGQLAQPAPNSEESDTNDLICCPILLVPMTHPVLCSLDGQTYEDSAIRKWLSKHKTSPHNRAEIPSGKTVDDVLIRNHLVESLIAAHAQTTQNMPA